MQTVTAAMSTGSHKISTRLQELISQANSGFPLTGEAIMADI
jgi:hypothetical protein